MLKTSEVEQELTPEELAEQARRRRAGSLERVTRLNDNVGFQELKAEVLKRKQRTFEALAKKLMSPHGAPLSEEDQAFEKGYWTGVTWVVEKLPDGLTKEFERLLEDNDEEEGEPA